MAASAATQEVGRVVRAALTAELLVVDVFDAARAVLGQPHLTDSTTARMDDLGGFAELSVVAALTLGDWVERCAAKRRGFALERRSLESGSFHAAEG
jgi:hypothetical protein